MDHIFLFFFKLVCSFSDSIVFNRLGVYLLRELTDEVLGKFLKLVPLQSGQRFRDWCSETHS